MCAIDYMEEKNWEITLHDNVVVFTSPKTIRFERTRASPATGRPLVDTVEARRQVKVVLGREWDRELGKIRCALAAICLRQCFWTSIEDRVVKTASMWPYTAEEIALQTNLLTHSG